MKGQESETYIERAGLQVASGLVRFAETEVRTAVRNSTTVAAG